MKGRPKTPTCSYTGLGSDLNGSDALAGTYKASANLVGLELTKTF